MLPTNDEPKPKSWENFIPDAREGATANHQAKLAHLEACGRLAPLLAKHGQAWGAYAHDWPALSLLPPEARAWRLAYAYGWNSINGLYLDLFLGKDDPLAAAAELVAEVGLELEALGYRPRGEDEHTEAQWRRWHWEGPGVIPAMASMGTMPSKRVSCGVRILWERSHVCKMVPTGKFREELRLDCGAGNDD